MRLIYLATPYSHSEPSVREQRFKVVNRVAARLIGEGLPIYSPISQSHPIAIEGEIPTDWDFWESYDRQILSICRKLIVLCQPGWDTSKGVTAEIEIAREMDLPIEYIDP